ncbi:MAG: metal-sensitive transcriptional regulator [Chloroflexota bacterium]
MTTETPRGAPRTIRRDPTRLLRRLARIEGQVRGVARMVERGEPAVDVLQQTAALRAALDAVTLLVIEEELATCVGEAARTRRASPWSDEAVDVVRRGMGRPARSGRPAAEA